MRSSTVWEESYCGVLSLKFVYVSGGSRDLARQALLFLCHFLSSFFVPTNPLLIATKTEKGGPVKEAMFIKYSLSLQ